MVSIIEKRIDRSALPTSRKKCPRLRSLRYTQRNAARWTCPRYAGAREIALSDSKFGSSSWSSKMAEYDKMEFNMSLDLISALSRFLHLAEKPVRGSGNARTGANPRLRLGTRRQVSLSFCSKYELMYTDNSTKWRNVCAYSKKSKLRRLRAK